MNALRKTADAGDLYRKILPFLVTVLLAFSSLYRLLSLKIDSDESQHMHIVWDWTKGVVQYRDVFDNHTPLFHMLMAPFIKLVGETPYILTAGRALMLPLFAGNLLFVYLIAKLLFNRKIALWLSFFTGFYLNYVGVSVEFRPDNLWILLWLGSVYYLLKSKISFSSGVKFGSLLALNSLVSLKTAAFLLPALGLAAFVSFASEGARAKERLKAGHAAGLKFLAGFILACALILAAFALIFYRMHALNAMLYGTIFHNLVHSSYGNPWLKSAIALLWVLAGILASRHYKNSGRPFVLFLPLVFSLLAVSVLYPVVERETRLIVSQMVFVLVGGLALQKLYGKISPKNFLLCVSAGYLVSLGTVMARPSYRNENKGYALMYADLLRLTDSSDYIMDAKGENIFRQRPYYFAFEFFTKKRLRQALLNPDQIIADITKKKADVLVALDEAVFPANLGAFSGSEYVYVDRYIKVAGKKIAGTLSPGGKTGFSMALDGYYTVLAKGANLEFQIDDKLLPSGQSVYLSAGKHCIMLKRGLPDGGITLILTKAVARGFYPAGFSGGSSSLPVAAPKAPPKVPSKRLT